MTPPDPTPTEVLSDLVKGLRSLHSMLNTPLPNRIHQMYIVEVLADAGFKLEDDDGGK